MDNNTDKTANVHQSINGDWYVTNDDLPFLDERGSSYKTEREAISAIRADGSYTHRLTQSGRRVEV